MDNKTDFDYKYGCLPECAPLATAYVPMQRSASPTYQAQMALGRGTMFPGLDLPFMGMLNDDVPATPLGRLMALDFVVNELGLYLDTHKDDKEAFAAYQALLAEAKEAKEDYVARFGPICKTDMLGMKQYCWLEGSWPWDYRAKAEV